MTVVKSTLSPVWPGRPGAEHRRQNSTMVGHWAAGLLRDADMQNAVAEATLQRDDLTSAVFNILLAFKTTRKLGWGQFQRFTRILHCAESKRVGDHNIQQV